MWVYASYIKSILSEVPYSSWTQKESPVRAIEPNIIQYYKRMCVRAERGGGRGSLGTTKSNSALNYTLTFTALRIVQTGHRQRCLYTTLYARQTVKEQYQVDSQYGTQGNTHSHMVVYVCSTRVNEKQRKVFYFFLLLSLSRER